MYSVEANVLRGTTKRQGADLRGNVAKRRIRTLQHQQCQNLQPHLQRCRQRQTDETRIRRGNDQVRDRARRKTPGLSTSACFCLGLSSGTCLPILRNWFVARSDSSKTLISSTVTTTDAYWQNYENYYDDIVLESLVKKGEWQKAIELSSVAEKQAMSNEVRNSIRSARGTAYSRRASSTRRSPISTRCSNATQPIQMSTYRADMHTPKVAGTTKASPILTRQFACVRKMRHCMSGEEAGIFKKATMTRPSPTIVRRFG